ncbi:MAG: hypothetical protein R6U78_15720 [Bacteroidales bacterium]
MRTADIIKEIRKLPIRERIYVIEKAIHSIREEEDKLELNQAAEALSEEYKTNTELTAFTSIDFEDFYETR